MLIRRILLFVLVIFIAPGLTRLAIWAATERPANWHEANWSSSGVLPPAFMNHPATVYVMAARTGGLKGAISKHSWIVLKKPGASSYQRFDVVGWGKPVKRNGWPADGMWYSNTPEIVFEAKGRKAELLIPEIEKAISQYRWRNYGDYSLWPGPNSNTFVASIIRAVPEFDAQMPAIAVGRDYPSLGKLVDFDAGRGQLRLSLFGYAGLMIGFKSGIEINLLGLVAGIDWYRPAIKLPGFGRIG